MHQTQGGTQIARQAALFYCLEFPVCVCVVCVFVCLSACLSACLPACLVCQSVCLVWPSLGGQLRACNSYLMRKKQVKESRQSRGKSTYKIQCLNSHYSDTAGAITCQSKKCYGICHSMKFTNKWQYYTVLGPLKGFLLPLWTLADVLQSSEWAH